MLRDISNIDMKTTIQWEMRLTSQLEWRRPPCKGWLMMRENWLLLEVRISHVATYFTLKQS